MLNADKLSTSNIQPLNINSSTPSFQNSIKTENRYNLFNPTKLDIPGIDSIYNVENTNDSLGVNINNPYDRQVLAEEGKLNSSPIDVLTTKPIQYPSNINLPFTKERTIPETIPNLNLNPLEILQNRGNSNIDINNTVVGNNPEIELPEVTKLPKKNIDTIQEKASFNIDSLFNNKKEINKVIKNLDNNIKSDSTPADFITPNIGIDYNFSKNSKENKNNNVSLQKGLDKIKELKSDFHKVKEDTIIAKGIRNELDESYLSGRPLKNSNEYLVLHHTGALGSDEAEKKYLATSKNASAHRYIDTKGNITRMALDKDITAHAGKSNWEGREGINDFSHGVEIYAGRDTKLNEGQLNSVADVINEWIIDSGKSLDNVLTHGMITRNKGKNTSRKDDLTKEQFISVLDKYATKYNKKEEVLKYKKKNKLI